MRVKLSIRIPSSSRGFLADKVSRAYARAVVDVAGPRIASLVRDRASAAADKLAMGFAPQYKAALAGADAVVVTEKAVTITVTDPIVVAAERGAPAFDMKAKLLSRGKPSKSGGVYVDVPIRHKPGSVPQAIRTAGRRAARSSGGVGQVRLPARTEGRVFTRALHRGPVAQAIGVAPKKQEVKHKRGVHDDLVRSATRKRGGGLVVRYTTIRRISSRSAASSWWHPGFKARHVLDEVLPRSRREIAAIIRDAIAARSA